MGLLLEGQGVLHPVNIVTVGVVLAGVGTTRLLAVGSGGGGLGAGAVSKCSKSIRESRGKRKNIRASEQIPELEGLNQVRVPDHAAVLDADLTESAVDLGDVADTIVQGLLGTENGDVRLHGLLHGQADVGGGAGTVRLADLVEVLDGVGGGVGAQGLELGAGARGVTDLVGDGTAKDDKIQQGVGTQTVGTVDGHTGGLTAGVQTGDNLVVAGLVDGQDLTSVLGGDTTHVVVDGGQDRDGLLADIDTRENAGSLRDTGQTLGQDLGRQMAQLQVDVVLVGADTTALADLEGHGTGDDVTRGQILGSRGVTLHEALTLAVQQVSTLTTSTLSDQAAGAVDTGRVELDELEILVGQTGAGNHGHTVTRAGVGRRAGEVGAAVTTSGQDGVVGKKAVQGAVLLVVGEDTAALAVLHDQVDDKVLDEVVGVVAQRLAVESVQQGVAGTISSGAATVGLATLAELAGLTTESTLVAVNC